MSPKPCAVTIGCTPLPACDIVKLIVSDQEFLSPSQLLAGVIGYPWHIDTKYYSADIHVCTLQEKNLGSQSFSNCVEAVILNFDSTKNEGLTEAEQWEPFIREWNPEVCILLCDHCEENPSKGISKLKAQEWCIERGYELVELNPEKDEGWEEDQDFIETTGIARVIQALHAHVWPNLTLKSSGDRTPRSLAPLQSSKPDEISSGLPPNASSIVEEILSTDIYDGLCRELHNICVQESGSEEQAAPDSQHPDDPPDELGSGGSTDDFFALFQNLAEMKERVANMTSDDRKASAERVVRAFWQAMGGDSDELSDVSDDAVS